MGFGDKPKAPPAPAPPAQKVEIEEEAKRKTLLAQRKKATDSGDTLLSRGAPGSSGGYGKQLG